MKYIRTKDGRILKGSNHGFGVCMPYKKYDVKVADTIEELCDEFVYETNKGNRIIKHRNDEIILLFDGEEPIAYYTAIWTDKGLIYVAKMNEKGELELL